MADLTEASLAEALAIIRNEPRSTPTHLIVTDEGIALVKHRIATEPDFRTMIMERASDDPEYREFLESVGISVK